MATFSTGYSPRPHQEYLHQRLKRFNVLVCHRRFGKTVFSINEILDKAFRCPRKNPTYAYVAPTYGAAKRIAWDYLKDATRDIPGAVPNESELKVEIPCQNGKIKIMLLGAENPGSLRGIYLDGVIMDEYSEMTSEVWNTVIRPALADRQGFAIFIFTPKGSNHAHDMYMYARNDTSGEWYVALFKSSETGILPKKELESAKQFMSDEEYEQEFECSFSAALVGAYYKDEMKLMEATNRITRVPYDKHALVHTGWDLGIDDSTAIWFIQQVGREFHAIEYYEVSSKGLDFIVKEILSKPYSYGKHLLPHDTMARELSTGKTRLEAIKALGLKNVDVVKKLSIEDGIHATRGVLSQMWMDRENCAWGVDVLKSYERVFNHKEQVFKAQPRHNWASHGADAMRTFSIGFRIDSNIDDKKEYPDRADNNYDVMGW